MTISNKLGEFSWCNAIAQTHFKDVVVNNYPKVPNVECLRDETSFFVRPAFYLDVDSAKILNGNGTLDAPYKLGYNGLEIYDGEYYKQKYSDLPDYPADSDELHSYWYVTDMLNGHTASPVYDYEYYKNNPIVVEQIGKEAYPFWCYYHFLTVGMAQGLRASEEFDPMAYKEYNFDLYSLYGDDNQKYYEHYVKIGRAEGRSGTPEQRSSQTIRGDADSNGSVNRADYMTVTKYFSGQPVTVNQEQADIDKDEKLTRKDYIYFSKFFSGATVPEFVSSY